jgi:hypothetical protein
MYGGGGSNEVKETPEEKELAKIAGERWERYQDVFVPLENQYMAEVDDMGTQQAMDEVTGQAVTNVMQGAEVPAVDPNRGQPGIGAALGRARAGAATKAATGLRGQHLQGMQGIVQMGQGQSASAMQGLGDVASQAASEAQGEAFRDFNRRQSWLNLGGQVAGAGMAYGMNGGGQSQGQMLSSQNKGLGQFGQQATRSALASNPNANGLGTGGAY